MNLLVESVFLLEFLVSQLLELIFLLCNLFGHLVNYVELTLVYGDEA